MCIRDRDATDEEVVAAAQLANADDFIRRLPDGYDTVIDGDGGSLSQGQCQLLSIARAAVADPPVMILDEATSSIDTRTESIVQAGMDGLMYLSLIHILQYESTAAKPCLVKKIYSQITLVSLCGIG